MFCRWVRSAWHRVRSRCRHAYLMWSSPSYRLFQAGQDLMSGIVAGIEQVERGERPALSPDALERLERIAQINFWTVYLDDEPDDVAGGAGGGNQ